MEQHEFPRIHALCCASWKLHPILQTAPITLDYNSTTEAQRFNYGTCSPSSHKTLRMPAVVAYPPSWTAYLEDHVPDEQCLSSSHKPHTLHIMATFLTRHSCEDHVPEEAQHIDADAHGWYTWLHFPYTRQREQQGSHVRSVIRIHLPRLHVHQVQHCSGIMDGCMCRMEATWMDEWMDGCRVTACGVRPHVRVRTIQPQVSMSIPYV